MVDSQQKRAFLNEKRAMLDFHSSTNLEQNADKTERTTRSVDFRLDENKIDEIVRDIEHHTTRYYDRRYMYKFALSIFTTVCVVLTVLNKT